jgi:hypothetical protein
LGIGPEMMRSRRADTFWDNSFNAFVAVRFAPDESSFLFAQSFIIGAWCHKVKAHHANKTAWDG